MKIRFRESYEDWYDRCEAAIEEYWSITTGQGELDNDLETFAENFFLANVPLKPETHKWTK